MITSFGDENGVKIRQALISYNISWLEDENIYKKFNSNGGFDD